MVHLIFESKGQVGKLATGLDGVLWEGKILGVVIVIFLQ